MASKGRLDAYLVAQGVASGREKAKELILGGAITVNGAVVEKPSFAVAQGDTVVCSQTPSTYVGRGALKLEKALACSAVSVDGAAVMDVGASTGGFTQCLLQHGAKKVIAVDVGHDQLHPLLRNDPRVENREGTDVRSPQLQQEIAIGSLDAITADVSFISLKQILPSVLPFLKDGGHLFLLIKPQFEAGKADVGKKGIVRDRAVHVRVLRELTAFFAQNGCSLLLLTGSPIVGGAGRSSGNIEYITVLKKEAAPLPLLDFRQLVDETFKEFN